jgi:hypothetical protein
MRVELLGGPRASVEVVEVPDNAGDSLRIVSPVLNRRHAEVHESPISGQTGELYIAELRTAGDACKTKRYRFAGYESKINSE